VATGKEIEARVVDQSAPLTSPRGRMKLV
jgi:hypothetical protein